MRNISFSMTVPQIKARTKTVTRRQGWANVKAGDVLMAVEKAQGLKKGEKVQRLGPIRVIDVREERIQDMTDADCVLEGFPELTRIGFILMYCQANKCYAHHYCRRIEFEYV